MADRALLADLQEFEVVTSQAFEQERSYMAQTYADLLRHQQATLGQSAPLELYTSIECAPDDDTRLRVCVWAEEHEGLDLLAVAADRPEHDDVRDIIQRVFIGGRDFGRFGPDDGTGNQLKRWLHARFVADRLTAAGVRAGMELTNASIDVTHKALQAALDEAGPLQLDLPGKIQPFKINITINSD